MNNTFLIPANSKKSMKIFGLFDPIDIVILGVGIFITFILVMALDIGNIVLAILAILPVSVAGFLVFPVPNYHNVRVFILSFWTYLTTRRTFIWRGWCVLDEEKTDKK